MANVVLRKLVSNDKDFIFSWISNPFLRKMTGTRGIPNEESHSAWFQNKINDDSNVLRVIEVDSYPVGLIGTNSIDLGNLNAELYLYIGANDHRKKGIGTTASRLFIDFLFKNYNIHKVYCRVFSYNEPSQKLFRKLGFQEEGRLKEHVFCTDENRFYDLILFGLLIGDKDEKENNDFRG